MEDWKKYVTMYGFKMIYKGIDIGISREFIEDLKANSYLVSDEILYI